MKKSTISFLLLFSLSVTSLCFAQEQTQTPPSTTTPQPAKPKMSKAQIQKAVIAKEKAVWEAVKKNNQKLFKSFFAKEYVGVDSYGIHNLNEDAQGVGEVKIKSYSLDDIKVTMPTMSVAIVTYKTKEEGEFKGQDISGEYYMSSVWMERGGKWMAVAHTETKAQ